MKSKRRLRNKKEDTNWKNTKLNKIKAKNGDKDKITRNFKTKVEAKVINKELFKSSKYAKSKEEKKKSRKQKDSWKRQTDYSKSVNLRSEHGESKSDKNEDDYHHSFWINNQEGLKK